MADMSKFSKKTTPGQDVEKNLLHCPKCNKEFPAQGRGRVQLVVDTVRNNQGMVEQILFSLRYGAPEVAKSDLKTMHKSDRDVLLLEGGILTSEQIELLK